jgi:tRNA(Ile)-lysidine synthase TilS/MesJ
MKNNCFKKNSILSLLVMLALLAAMANLRIFYPEKFELVAITLDPRFGGEDADYSEIEELCKKLDVEYIIKRTQLAEVIFDIRKESNPCSLCARMRRGALHDAAKAAGCNKIALGHHLDDVAETYMMNIILAGRAGCFCPEMTYENSGIRLIRPFVYLREGEINGFASSANLPVIEKICPVDGDTERQHFKELLRQEDIRHRGVYTRILGALERSGVDGWKE